MDRYLNELDDTIIAVATGIIRAGISVIRMSGKKSLTIAAQMTLNSKIEHQRAFLTKIYNQNKEIIDESIVVFFQNPSSLTGEDVIEFQCHGSPVIVESIIENCLLLGARLAHPGEFLQRAYLNEKYDLVQVEAIASLINSKTQQAAKLSLKAAKGELSSYVKEIHNSLNNIRSLLEVSLDFSDQENIDDYIISQAKDLFGPLISKIETVLSTSERVIQMHKGINLCLIGPPNAGKSSLINHLAQESIAIVHDEEGTTRDTLKASIAIEGVPITIIDTAGLRETTSIVEKIGIDKTKEEAIVASVLVYVLPHGQSINVDDLALLKKTSGIKILLINKIDQYGLEPYEKEHSFFDREIGVSILTNQGIELLISFLTSQLIKQDSFETPFIVNLRQLNVIKEVLALINKSRDTMNQVEIAADILKEASNKLGSLTGRCTTEDLLDQIFSTFCLGK